MLHPRTDLKGFTIPELVVVIVLIGIVGTAFFTFTNTSINQYLSLQQEGYVFNDLATQSQRVAKVLRGLTDITAATQNEISVYAYFSPQDTYVSLIRYYKNLSGTILYADVTPMTQNPPNGTLKTAELKTYTIMDNFYSAPGVNLFEYLDSAGAVIPQPIADLHTIKGIRVNLAVPTKTPSISNDAMTLSVSLRNRKTNL